MRAVASGTTTALAYMPQLDGLRTVAVSCVIIHHLVPGQWGYGGAAGVRLFFVLSGFLITRILLAARDSAPDSGGSGTALGRFYARRFLRIFPLYYAVIAVALALNFDTARGIYGWLVSYTVNFKVMRDGNWDINLFSHFWSLSVEEQFYLGWPWLVLFLSPRVLKSAAVMMICVGPFYRVWYILSGALKVNDLGLYVSTFTSLDALGLGALLAILLYGGDTARLRYWLNRAVLPASLAAVLWAGLNDSWASLVVEATAQSVLFATIIYYGSIGIKGPIGNLLGSRPLVYVGRISYGVYVYHVFVIVLFRQWLIQQTGMSRWEALWIVAPVGVLATLVLAAVSWRLMELPINRLKRLF